MFEVGDLVRFRGPTGIIGQILDVDAYESRAGVYYRVLLLTDPRYYAGGEFDSAPYYIADVFVTEFSCKEVWITDDVELLSESR